MSLIGINAQKSELLSASDSKKIASSDKKISKGDLITERKVKYTSQIEELENNEGRVRIRKIERLTIKANKEVIKSASYYKDGYGKKYKTYKKAVSRGIKNEILSADEVGDVKKHAAIVYKNGRKWRRKSSNQSDVSKAVDYLLKANGVEADAIKSLVKILDLGMVAKDENFVVDEQVKDSLVEIPDTSLIGIIKPTVLLVANDSMVTVSDSSNVFEVVDSISKSPELIGIATVVEEDSVSNEPEKVKELLLYFSVQFLAEKKPVPKEKIRSLYNGSLEVIKHEADGWCRYSIGRFEKLEDAKEMIAKSGIEGYVVAYNNKERISTRRAVELMTAE